MDTSKVKLHLKRSFVLFMTALLTWQTLGVDITYAFAQDVAAATQEETQANASADTSADGEDGGDQTVSQPNESTAQQTSAPAQAAEPDRTQPANTADASNASSSSENADGAASATESANDDDEQSNETAPQNAENGIALASESGDGSTDVNGTYNPDADPVEISSSTCSSINANLSYDSEGANPYDGSAILPTDTLYAKVHVVFSSTGKPTLEQPNVSYTLPKTLNVANKSSDTLLDSNNEKAGTWEITNNTVLLKFSEEWLTKHASEVSANFSLHFTLSDKSQGDGDSTTFTFPGTTTTVTIPTKDGSVDGSKSAGSFNADDNTFTWTIKVSPKTAAHNLVVSDTIGSNLSFVDGSFTFTDANGAEIAGTTYSTSGQNATFNLGNLTAGDYYVKYTTKVSQSALGALTDGKALSDVENKCSWKWGTTNPQTHTEITANPETVKYSMVSKSASGTNSDITWTVKLNTGSLKADMSGYTFTDTLGEGHHFIDGTKYSVTDASGNEIAQGDVDANSSTLSFELPDNVGKKSLTVTYHTTMNNTSSLNPVKNTSKVTPEDDGVTGKDEATYNPTDTTDYVEKKLTSRSDDGSTASWTSTVKFKSMATDTDASKVQWVDTISRSIWATFTFSDLVLKAGDVTLAEGTDYSVTNGDASCTVTFKDSATVKALIGKTDVVITYTTTIKSDGGNPVASGQKFTNTSVLNYDSVKKGEASESYSIVSVPSVIKKANGSKWDPTYKWSDDTTGAWIISWEAWVNSYGNYHDSILDLGKNDVVLTDTLPEGMEYKTNSFKYILEGNDGYNNVWETQGTEPEISGNTVTFRVSTSGVANTAGEWVGKAKFKFDTAVKNDIAAGESKEYSNSASAQSGEYTFPSGTGTTTIKNNILTKTHTNESGSSDNKGARIKYTITVNPNSLDLVDGDTLTLVDTMSSTLSFIGGSLKVVDASNTDITSSCTHSLENKTLDGKETTVLTLGVPDAKKLTITYQCSPIGVIGKEVTVSNSCTLSGMMATEKTDSASWSITKSDAGADAVSYGLTVKKVAQNDTSKTLKGAKFKLSSVNTTTGNKTEVGTATTGSDGIATFGTKEQPLTSGTLYFVEETEAPEGYEISYEGSYVLFYPATATNEAIEEFNAAYEAAQNLGHEPIIGTVSDASATGPGVTFTVYDKLESGKFSLDVSKAIEGADAPEDTEFTFTATPQEAAPQLKTSRVTITGNGTAQFESVNGALTEDMIGKTYYYTIHEDAPTDTKGWAYDTQDVTAAVRVIKENDAIKAEVTYSKTDENVDTATFTNTYATTGTPILHVKKTVNSGKLDTKFKDKTFTFGVYKADAEGKKTGDKLQQVQVKPSETVYINNIETYTSEGVHRYVIHEENADEGGWALAGDVLVTVTAKDNGEGALDLTYEYSAHPSDDTNAALFDNTYTEPTTATLQAQKKLTGRDMSGEEFSFQLIDKNEGTTKDQVIDSASAPAAEDGVAATVTFDPLRYTKAGTYYYGIKEIEGNLAHVTYDTSVYTAKVEVTKDETTGKLNATVTYLDSSNATLSNGKLPLFVNTYTAASGSFTLKAKKTVNDGSLKDDESFTFSATATGENATTAPTFQNATTDKSGIATFATVSVDDANIGKTYTYTIHEEGELDETHWTRAADVEAKVTIGQRDGDNKIPVTVTYNDQKSEHATFDNTYSTSTSATLKVSKVTEGTTDAETDKEFTFALYNKGENEALQTVTAKAGQTVSFPNAIDYTAAGTHEYDIKELGEDGDGWELASATTATVTVNENNDRSLTATVEYGRSNNDKTAALFTNIYSASGTASIKVSKTINGEAPTADKTFDFELKAVTENAPMPEGNGNKVTTTGSAVASFGDITYSVTDAGKTYEYQIVETSNLGTGWTKANPLKVTVTVGGDNGDGTLKESTVTYGEDENASSGVMNNLYESGSASISVEKTVNGGPIAEGEQFTFKLLDKDNKQIGSEITATKENPTVTFDKLTFDKTGTYTYTVHETSNLGEGWTNDADITVTLTVEEVAGKFKVTETKYGDDKRGYDKDGNYIVKFDDKYETSVTAHLSVSKAVLGATEATENTTFDFALYDVTGMVFNPKPIDTLSGVKANETKQFAKDLTFSKPGIYKYCIHEVGNSLSDAWLTGADVYAEVTVGMNENRTLYIQDIKYGNSATDTAAKFINTYAPAKSTIEVAKTVNGGPIAEGEKFTFKLLDSDGKQIGTEITATKDSPTVAFAELSFENAGTYTYTVHETSELGDGWTNDADIDVTLTVEKVDGKLTVTSVKYGDDTRGYDEDGNYIVKFDDMYEAKAAKSEIKVEKTVNGGPIETGEKFTFTLLDADGNKVTGTDEITATKDNPTASFGELTFDKAGTYVYTVHETSELGDGWTNDDDFTVTFTVMLGDDRNLHVTNIAYGERGYEADGTVVAKFDDKFEKPEKPEENKPEQPKKIEKTVKSVTQTTIPATDDANRGVLVATSALALGGMALIALGLHKLRRNAG